MGHSFTFDVDICFSGGGETFRVVRLAAELSVLVHTCNRHIEENNVAVQCCVISKQPVLKVVIGNQPQWFITSYFTSMLGSRGRRRRKKNKVSMSHSHSKVGHFVQSNWVLWVKGEFWEKVQCQPQWRSKTDINICIYEKNRCRNDSFLQLPQKLTQVCSNSKWSSPVWCTVVTNLLPGLLPWTHNSCLSVASDRPI